MDLTDLLLMIIAFDNLVETYTTSSHLSMVSFALDTLWKRNSLWRLPNLGYRQLVLNKNERITDEIELAANSDAVPTLLDLFFFA